VIRPVWRDRLLDRGPGFYPYPLGRENLRVVADLASVSQRRVDEVLDLIEMNRRVPDASSGPTRPA